AAFANLNDMAAFTVSIPWGRWYFHHEAHSQFGGSGETLGFAPAQFALVPAASVQATILRMNTNTVRLQFRGPPARGIVLEHSADLSSWTPLVTNSLNSTGAWSYTHSMSGAVRRFYRAILP